MPNLGHSLNLWLIESSFFTHTIALGIMQVFRFTIKMTREVFAAGIAELHYLITLIWI